MIISMLGHRIVFNSLIALYLFAVLVASQKEDDETIYGYFIDGAAIETMTVPSPYARVTFSGSFAGVCATSPRSTCIVNVGCENGIVTRNDNYKWSCSKNDFCRTMTIYQTSPDVGPTTKEFFCASVWSAHTIYRRYPGLTTSTVSTSSTSSSPLVAKSTEAASTQGTSTSASLGQITTPPDSGSGSGAESKAWIAGPVIGGVVALALFAVGMFWCGRRYRRRDESATNETANTWEVPDNKSGFSPALPCSHTPSLLMWNHRELQSSMATEPAELGGSQPQSSTRPQDLPVSNDRA